MRGNHDAASPGDQALLRRMAKIPNVVLLEPTPQSYAEVTVNGVVLAGFNDPRFFGDDSKDMVGKERPAAEAFNEAYADRPRPDIVVTHEPAAARMVRSATLLVNGHLHKDELDGNRIGVGTFTGGGTVSVAQAEVILGQLPHQLALESVRPGSLAAVGALAAVVRSVRVTPPSAQASSYR